MDKRFDGFTLAESDNSTPMGRVSEGREGIKAFTLAEVLITLGVIGVVSAITMPTLIKNHQKQVTVTKLKKAYSEISQAIKLSEVHNGEMENWDFSNAGTTEGERNKYFAENYIFPYLKTVKICEQGNHECSAYASTARNSAIIQSGYSITTWQDTTGGWVYVDIDGPNKGKNQIGNDIFGIKFVRQMGNLDSGNNATKKGIYLNGLQLITPKTRDELKENNEYCGALIMYDGWKILDDNPCFSK